MALVIAAYLDDAEVHLPPMSIRLAFSNLLSLEEIQKSGQVVRAICESVFDAQRSSNTNGSGVCQADEAGEQMLNNLARGKDDDD